jgi:neutral ceramidase
MSTLPRDVVSAAWDATAVSDANDAPWLVGAGSADVTGEPWNVGLMGYGMRFQRSTGIHLRQRSRAFVLVDRATEQRLVYVVADIGMFFRNVREAVLARLDSALYGADNVVLTATHTHAGVGGYSCYRLYNMTQGGFRPHTFNAIVDGVVESIHRAEADLAPGRLRISRGQLHAASVNRSPQSFARNPDQDRAVFPEAIDPTTTLLRLERDGALVGAINWFATHGTSLTNRNMLISGDNKGYAAYRWEREVGGVDYLQSNGPGKRGLVTAFAQTNAGDMSPNVPDATQGPTDDEYENARVVGARQFDAAYALAADAGEEVTGGLDTRLRHVRLTALDIDAQWTPDGRPHRTGRAVLGAAFAAGTKEGPGAAFCHEGVDANPVIYAVSRAIYRLRPGVGASQRPKAMFIPCGLLGWTAEVLPVQLVRIGPLVLIAVAQEVTIVAGLRLRRAVADVLGTTIDNVLVQGYANDYAGYLTTPEEYDGQRYEGGHTMFGRWQLPAYLQEVTRLAVAIRDGAPVDHGTLPPPAKNPRPARLRDPKASRVQPRPPEPSYRGGDVVTVAKAVPDPRGRVQPSYFCVEQQDGTSWNRIASDGDWSTRIEWHRDGQWSATMSWHMPIDAVGSFRMRYLDETVGEFAVTSATAPHAATTAPTTGP